MWLDGSDPNGDGTFLTDGSSVNSWFDKSGYNRNAIAQSFPNSSVAIIKNDLVNNLPIIRCNGNQRDFVNYQSFPNANYTVFTVQLCNAVNSSVYQRLISGSDHDFSLVVGVNGTNISTFTGNANETWNDISTRLYQQSSEESTTGESESKNGNDEVEDTDFEEVK